jgi:hypothetical protein
VEGELIWLEQRRGGGIRRRESVHLKSTNGLTEGDERGKEGGGGRVRLGISIKSRVLLTEELSWKAMIELSVPEVTDFDNFKVSFTRLKSVCSFSTPSMIIFPPKNQWRECSLFD